MFLSHIKFRTELLAPPESTAGDDGNKSVKTTDDILNFLNEEEDETIDLKEEKKEKKEKEEVKDKNEETDEEVEEIKKKDKEDDEEESDEEDEDDKDELDEIEDELEEPSEEDLELEEDVPTRREILKAYPDLFKKFPQLEKSYFRERQFTKYFANPKDAEEAISNSETLEKFGSDLANGDLTRTLTAVKSFGGEKAFHKLVDNYLDVIQKVDKDAHQHIFANVIKNTIGHMIANARENGDDDLMELAAKLNKYVFNSDKYLPPTKLSKVDDKEDPNDVISKKENELLQQRFDDARSEMNDRVSNILRRTIKANIDKKEEMSEFVRRSAIREAMDTVENLINKDSRLRQLVDKLWDAAAKDNFSKKSLDKIKSAFDSRARILLPSVIKKARTDALRGIARKKAKVENDNDEQEETQEKEKPNSNKKGKKPESLSGIDTLEYLMQD